MIKELIYYEGDNKIIKGDYFIFVINPQGAEFDFVVHKITNQEYIVLKLKNKPQTIYQVTKGKLDVDTSIKYKIVYKI